MVLVLLASPSVVWLVMTLFGAVSSTSQQGIGAELLYVVSCFLAAAAAWAAIRFWPLLVLIVAAIHTYVITLPLVTGVLLTAPGGYVVAVLKEATARGIVGGFSLIWSLLVLPIAFPTLFMVAAWLCAESLRTQRASAI